MISNRIRRSTIQSLDENQRTCLEPIASCGLDADRHCGWFNHHLGVLLGDGIIVKKEDQYLLTDYGKGIARLLNTVEGESRRLFQKEVTPMKKDLVINFHG